VELSDDHECKEYVVSRKIPMDFLSDLFYAENFAEFVHGYIPDKQVGQEPRLIIPLRDADKKLIGFQGRAIYPSEVKYITIKFDENQEYLSYGMDRVDLNSTVYVTEGPIDSMFLPNAVAILGMNHELDPSVNDPVFVLDNEPRNREVIKQYEKLIKNDYRVCIWPDNITQKDVNDMVRSGMSRREVLETINKNIYSGLSAELRLSVWKKV